MEDAAAKLEELAGSVQRCERCPQFVASRLRALPGAGHPHAHLMLVALHPSEDEEAAGRPAGSSLRAALAQVIPGLPAESVASVYCTALLKCVPRGDAQRRSPSVEELANCYGYLSREISTITPHVLVPVGRQATAFLLLRLFGEEAADSTDPLEARVYDSPAFRVAPLASAEEIAALDGKARRAYLERLRPLVARLGL